MNNKTLLLLGATFILGACGGPSSSNTETLVDAPQKSFTLEYDKFTLDNGLEVVLHVDKSDPIVALTTVVHAGSNREKPGRTGFAHFFEHMAFNDSENVPRGWNRKAIPDWGGQRNGGTWSDGTIYYEVVPKDAFDKILWIDSDRLGYMINTVTTAALEREKQVVKNEKRQRVDNAPYGYTQEVIRKNLYPEGHPYSWTVIGALPDLQAATLEDLKEFYAELYGPNNATLSIVGDIDIAETKRKVQQWFGEIKPGPAIKALPPMPVTLSDSQSFYFEDNFAKLPELRITFPTVEAYHTDETALEMLAQIIAGSKNSVLYKQIVEQDKLAPNVSSYNNSMELAGEFVFRIRANAGTDLDAVKAALDTALSNFERDGVDGNDLKRIKAEQETILYSDISTVLGKSNQLATDNEFAGDPAYAIKNAQQLNAVMADDIMRVYEKYLKGKPSIITSFVPKGQSELALTDAKLASVWIEEVKSDVASEEVSQGAEAEYEKTPSTFDRSEPDFGELPLVKMPPIWSVDLPNNIQVLGIKNSETPLVNFDVTIDGGSWLDPIEKKGTARLLAALMNEGTASKTAAELEQATGLLGSGITVSASAEELTISATSLSRNFEATVALVNEILSSPRWNVDDFDKVKSATLTSIKGREANPTGIALLNFNKLIYGDQHPLGLSQSGNTESVSATSMDDLKSYYQSMRGAPVRIHIAGDISKERAGKAFESVANNFVDTETEFPEYKIPEQSNTGKVFFIDVPGSKQSVIGVGRLTLASTGEDFNKLQFTNEKLGGGISGDLAQVLRIEKGYTYGAYSRITNGKTAQPFSASTSVRANATQASLEVIRDMLANYGKNFSVEDVETTKQKLVKENTRAFESLGAKLRILRNMSKYGKSRTYVEDDQQELVAMTLEDFKSTADQYLSEPDMIYLIVGDKATQFEPVKEFAGGDVTELDIYGNVIE
jgi:zinc protease